MNNYKKMSKYKNSFRNVLMALLGGAMLCAACKKDEPKVEDEPKSAACEIVSFTVNGNEWNINGTDITHAYPAETEETSLTPAITLSPGATVNPPANAAQNFFTDEGVTYTVTAEDGVAKKTYTAKATRASYTACDIVSFSVNGVAWEIDGTDIIHAYPAEAATTNLAPTITLSPGATVNPPSGEEQNFFTEEGVTYTVTAEDGVEKKTYTAKATVQAIASGMTGECIWALTGVPENYTLTVSGNGAMGNHGYQSTPWYQYRDDIKNAVIQDGVTTIGDWAFSQCYGLTSVIIPNSVTTIGDYAFYDCSSLTTVSIPNSVTYIDGSAFAFCSDLTAINADLANTQYCSENGVLFNKDKTTLVAYPGGKTGNSYVIPNSVTSIGDYAFYYCSGLISVTIPNSVTAIGEHAFSGCSGLTSVTIGNSVTTIGDRAFVDCSGLTTVTIPNSVTAIGNYAFASCSSLTSVTIGNSVTTIGNDAFYYCRGLTSVTNLNPVPQTISSDVFYYSNISVCTLKVPASAVNDYKAAPVWREFGNIVANE
jgi:hypothetical protein